MRSTTDGIDPREAHDELADYFGALWRRRVFILAGTIVAALSGLAYARLAPTWYQTETTLLVEAEDAALIDPAWATLGGFLRRSDVLVRAIAAVGASGDGADVANVTIAGGVTRNVATVKITSADSATAARIADSVVAEAVSLYEKYEAQAAVAMRAALARRLDSATARLDSLEQHVADLQRQLSGHRSGSAPATDLERDLKRREAELSFARNRYAQLKSQLQESDGVSFSVISRAGPATTLPGRTALTVVLSTLAGAILSMAAAFLIDFFSQHGFRHRAY